jgi:hypothetical protein
VEWADKNVQLNSASGLLKQARRLVAQRSHSERGIENKSRKRFHYEGFVCDIMCA